MALVKTTIDGQEVEVERDRWALDVARELGIEIPTLCRHPAVEPYGACRLCVVEVAKGKWTWLTTSCDLPVRDGLSIRTGTPAVLAARRLALELLWSSAPQAGVIAEMARGMGIEHPRFGLASKRGKCILCGLCVRVCQKVLGDSAVCFARRGSSRRLATPMDSAPETCIGCGACVRVCPTGHIESEDDGPLRRMGALHASLELAGCERCGEPFAPRRQLQHARARLPDNVTVTDVCPRCRRAQSAKRLSDGLGAPEEAGQGRTK
jgi:predicted molibdopterin-dependent oxidoreductase YjgC